MPNFFIGGKIRLLAVRTAFFSDFHHYPLNICPKICYNNFEVAYEYSLKGK